MKKKGFTLIELLAVIVILAVLAIVITPIVTDLVKNTKKSSARLSAQAYIRAVNDQIVSNSTNYQSLVSNGNDDPTAKAKLINDTYYDTKLNNVYTVADLGAKDVKVDGDQPSDGRIVVSNGEVLDYWLTINGFTFEYDLTSESVLDTSDTPTNLTSKLNLPAIAFLESKGNLSKDSTTDANLISNGTNNYLKIDGKTFRIIGIFNNVLDNNDVSQTRIKLIDTTSYGTLSFSTGSNLWTNSSLKDNLINNYLPLLTTINSTNLIAQYNIGYAPTTDTYRYEHYITYTDVHGAVYNVSKAKTAKSTIGLMNASDCQSNSWLSGYGWTLTPVKGTDTSLYVCSGDKTITATSTTATTAVHPVIYLSDGVVLNSSNTGTAADPYTILKAN